jgi:hypothetical protein
MMSKIDLAELVDEPWILSDAPDSWNYNEQARRLYARLGFLEYGLEKNALKQGGRYYDEVTYGERLSGRMIACRYRARLPR